MSGRGSGTETCVAAAYYDCYLDDFPAISGFPACSRAELDHDYAAISTWLDRQLAEFQAGAAGGDKFLGWLQPASTAEKPNAVIKDAGAQRGAVVPKSND